jgi:hypothetical protein
MIARRLGVDDDIADLALYRLEDSGEALATRFIHRACRFSGKC